MKIKIFYFTLFLLIIITTVVFLFSNKSSTVAVIGAMDTEIKDMEKALSGIKCLSNNDFKITTGKIGKYKIILSKSGVGKVAAATTTQYIIDKYKPVYIINIGVAGSLSSDLKAGDLITAEKMVQHDFDVTAFGNPKGYIDNGIEPDKPTIFYSDKTLINKFTKNYNIKSGTIATGDIFVTDIKLKNNIKKEFNADAIDMESAAIAQTARRNNLPVIVIRTISDELNASTTEEYKQNKTKMANKPVRLIVEFLKSDK